MRPAPREQETKVGEHASGSLLVAASLLFWMSWAGEQTEVVVLRTRDDGGAIFETKMWVVD